jgi:hypothetical protein
MSINESLKLLFRQILAPAIKHNTFEERPVRPDLPVAGRVFQVQRRRIRVIATEDHLEAFSVLQ